MGTWVSDVTQASPTPLLTLSHLSTRAKTLTDFSESHGKCSGQESSEEPQ